MCQRELHFHCLLYPTLNTTAMTSGMTHIKTRSCQQLSWDLIVEQIRSSEPSSCSATRLFIAVSTGSTTCPCFEPDESSSHHLILLTKWSFLILFFHLSIRLLSRVFSTGFPPKFCMHFLLPYVCHMPHSSAWVWSCSFNNIWRGGQIIRRPEVV